MADDGRFDDAENDQSEMGLVIQKVVEIKLASEEVQKNGNKREEVSEEDPEDEYYDGDYDDDDDFYEDWVCFNELNLFYDSITPKFRMTMAEKLHCRSKTFLL